MSEIENAKIYECPKMRWRIALGRDGFETNCFANLASKPPHWLARFLIRWLFDLPIEVL